MDQILSKALRFDRFTLDLARARLQIDNREIGLRPKAFDLLRHLAENAGRLVTKRELYEAVWPNVTVTDDVLVQCIRELRQLLGDTDHSLIKTLSRRGYLLDAQPRTLAPLPDGLSSFTSTDMPERTASRSGEGERNPVVRGAWQRIAVAAAVGLLCLGLGALVLPRLGLQATPEYPAVRKNYKPPPLPPSAVNKLFSENDARRVADIARSKQLPAPNIEFDTPDDGIPIALRRFIGVWVSTKGFVGTNRQFMFTVTHVEKEGLAGGFTVRGPPAPNSAIKNPAAAVAFTAFISDNVLTYSNPRGEYKVWFAEQNELVFKQTFVTGDTTMVAMEPVWTLLEAERAGGSRPLAQ